MTEFGEDFGGERADGGEFGVTQFVAEHGDERAGDGAAGDRGPSDAAGAEGFEDIRVGSGDVAAVVNDSLGDGAAGGGEHVGQDFAAAASAGEEELFATGVRGEFFGEGFSTLR